MIRPLIVYILILPFKLNAQTEEQLFREDYGRLGFEFGFKKYQVENVDGQPAISWNIINTKYFGLTYSFWQRKSFNLKAGARLSNLLIVETVSYMKDTMLVTSAYGSGIDGLYEFPVEGEYYFLRSGKFNLSLIGGLELAINPNRGMTSGGGWTEIGINYNFVAVWKGIANPNSLYYGVNIGTSMTFELDLVLLKVTPRIHIQLDDYIYRTIGSYYNNGITGSSEITLTGTYAGIDFSIHPYKIFKKKFPIDDRL